MTAPAMAVVEVQGRIFQRLARQQETRQFERNNYAQARRWREAADAVDAALASHVDPAEVEGRNSGVSGEPVDWARFVLAQVDGAGPVSPKDVEAVALQAVGRAMAPSNKQIGVALGWMANSRRPHPEARRVGRGQYVATKWLKPSKVGAPRP